MRAFSGKPNDDITRAPLGMCGFYLWLCLTFAAGPVSLLTMWTNRITAANSRKHQEFVGRVSSVNNKFELYQQLKDENGCVIVKYLLLHGCNIECIKNACPLHKYIKGKKEKF